MTPPVGHVEIRERVTRVAYPRNGNLDNPTRYKVWDIYVNGQLHLTNLKFREATKLARSLQVTP